MNLRKRIKKIFVTACKPIDALIENERLQAEFKKLQNAMFCENCVRLKLKIKQLENELINTRLKDSDAWYKLQNECLESRADITKLKAGIAILEKRNKQLEDKK